MNHAKYIRMDVHQATISVAVKEYRRSAFGMEFRAAEIHWLRQQPLEMQGTHCRFWFQTGVIRARFFDVAYLSLTCFSMRTCRPVVLGCFWGAFMSDTAGSPFVGQGFETWGNTKGLRTKPARGPKQIARPAR